MAATINANTFHTYDADGNGVLDENEMEAFLNKTGQSGSYWDANGSGDITEAEFNTDLQVRNDVKSHASGNNWSKADFHAIDSNHDGKLTLDEWKAFGLDPKQFNAHKGADNTITHQKWDDLVDSIKAKQASSGSGGGGGKK